MATCTKCFKPLPDEAAHCGYCGTAVKRAAPPAEAPAKRTVFGYSPSPDELKELARARGHTPGAGPSAPPAEPRAGGTASRHQERPAVGRPPSAGISRVGRPPSGEVPRSGRPLSGEVPRSGRPPSAEVPRAARPPSAEVPRAARPVTVRETHGHGMLNRDALDQTQLSHARPELRSDDAVTIPAPTTDGVMPLAEPRVAARPWGGTAGHGAQRSAALDQTMAAPQAEPAYQPTLAAPAALPKHAQTYDSGARPLPQGPSGSPAVPPTMYAPGSGPAGAQQPAVPATMYAPGSGPAGAQVPAAADPFPRTMYAGGGGAGAHGAEAFPQTVMAQGGMGGAGGVAGAEAFPATLHAGAPSAAPQPFQPQPFQPSPFQPSPFQPSPFQPSPFPPAGQAPAVQPYGAASGYADADETAPFWQWGVGALRAAMLVGGILLVLVFCAPWRVLSSGSLRFSWDFLSGLDGLAFVGMIYIAAGGVLLATCALLPLPYLLRAALAVLVGLTPLVLGLANATWREAALVGGLLVLPVGLLHRARFGASVLSRIVVVLGLLGVLATFLVPRGSTVPLVAILEALGRNSSGLSLSRAIFALLPLPLALLGLLAFLPARKTGLATLWAVLLLAVFPLGGLAQTAFLLERGNYNFTALFTTLTVGIYLTVTAVGLAQLLAGIDHPEPVA